MTEQQAVAIFEQYGGADWLYLAWLGAVTVATFVLITALLIAAATWHRR